MCQYVLNLQQKIFVATHIETTTENGQDGVKNRTIVTTLVTALSRLGVKARLTGKFGDAEDGCSLEWFFMFSFHTVYQLLKAGVCICNYLSSHELQK